MEMIKMIKEGAKSQPMSLSNDKDVTPHVFSFIHHTVNKFGTFLSHLPSYLTRVWINSLIKILFTKLFCNKLEEVYFPKLVW